MKRTSNSGEFQEIESNYFGNFLTFPIDKQSFQVHDQCWAATDASQLIHGICLKHRERFFGNPRPMSDSPQTSYQGTLHSTTPGTTGAIPVQGSTGTPVARGEERIWSKTPMPMSARRPSTMIFFASGNSAEFFGWTAKTTDIGASIWQIRHSVIMYVLEEKIQNPGEFLFRFSLGSYVMDQRSGDSWFSGWFKIFVLCKRKTNAKIWSTRCEDCFSTEQNHP